MRESHENCMRNLSSFLVMLPINCDFSYLNYRTNCSSSANMSSIQKNFYFNNKKLVIENKTINKFMKSSFEKNININDDKGKTILLSSQTKLESLSKEKNLILLNKKQETENKTTSSSSSSSSINSLAIKNSKIRFVYRKERNKFVSNINLCLFVIATITQLLIAHLDKQFNCLTIGRAFDDKPACINQSKVNINSSDNDDFKLGEFDNNNNFSL